MKVIVLLLKNFLIKIPVISALKAGLTDTERELQLGSQISVDIDDEAWAFGEDPTYMGGDRRGQDDEQTYEP